MVPKDANVSLYHSSFDERPYYYSLVLRSVFAVKEFDTIIAITDAGPNWVTETMNLNIYFNAFEYQYLGEASGRCDILHADHHSSILAF